MTDSGSTWYTAWWRIDPYCWRQGSSRLHNWSNMYLRYQFDSCRVFLAGGGPGILWKNKDTSILHCAELYLRGVTASALGPPVTVVVSDVWSVLTQKMEGSPSKFPDRCGKIQGSQVPPLPRAPQDLHGAPGGENGERPCGRTDPSWTWEKWRSDEAFLVTVSASSVHSRGYYTIVLNLLSRVQSYIYIYIHVYVYI